MAMRSSQESGGGCFIGRREGKGNPKSESRNPKEIRSPKSETGPACTEPLAKDGRQKWGRLLRPPTVGRRSCGATTKAERRHSCRPVRAVQDLADKNVGDPPWWRLRRSVAPPARECEETFSIFTCHLLPAVRFWRASFGFWASVFGLRFLDFHRAPHATAASCCAAAVPA